ncbi:hypothetical protein BHE74_00015342 [Ensete ventricosum]|nr:hypothetical protein BHE74_00015342 [Ensete ventricosum]
MKVCWTDLLAPTHLWDDRLVIAEFARGTLHPFISKQLYGASSEELVDQAMKSMVWNLHFSTSLADRVHDANRIIEMLSERNFTLRNEVLDIKLGVGPEAIVAAEKRVVDLEVKLACTKAALGDTEQCCQSSEQEVELAQGKALQIELQSTGAKAIVKYKMSLGFELSMERTRHTTYEFGYRVALECLRAKYPDLSIEEDPFADCPEDSNMQMEDSQPFDDSIPPQD